MPNITFLSLFLVSKLKLIIFVNIEIYLRKNKTEEQSFSWVLNKHVNVKLLENFILF